MSFSFKQIREFFVGKPKDIHDHSIFHRLALVPFLAWVGLGADGLSSSAYGPEEAFKALGEHQYLAVLLVFLMAMTVLIISAAYRKIIEAFPHGGGGYVVASKLLGRKVGLVSGCALLVDYVLTITISIAAACDALFSFLPIHYHHLKIPLALFLIAALTILNIRGVKESVLILTPIFVIFIVTHAAAILLGVLGHIPEIAATSEHIKSGFQGGMSSLGPWALFLLFIHAYSLGGGTYTGIEAVSNGLPIMREPRVKTAKRTMTYMAFSLAFTASGLLLCYLLWRTLPQEGQTLNAVLLHQISEHFGLGNSVVIISLLSEGLLLVVAAQAGFIDGPRVLANMAVDSWVPRKFASLSDRLTTANGILLMGGASVAAFLYTGGAVSKLVVMYSINVFLTFSLSILGMLISQLKSKKRIWDFTQFKNLSIFFAGFILCATILVITISEKFLEGGWITLLITSALIGVCLMIRKHYYHVSLRLSHLNPRIDRKEAHAPLPIDPKAKTAAILVGGYGGLGIHTVQSITRIFPGVFKNFVFISVGVIDSGAFKGEDAVHTLQQDTDRMLHKYVELGRSLGIASVARSGLGIDVVEEGSLLCKQVSSEFQETTFFTGKIIFEEEKWYQKLLHNETGFALQKKLQLSGLTMVILPAKVA